MNVLRAYNLGACSHIIGKLNDRDVIEFTRDAKSDLQAAAHRTAAPVERNQLAHRAPARQPGLRRCGIRPHPGCRRSRHHAEADVRSAAGYRRAFHRAGARPRVAILREQGVNSHVETAYVMHKSGFTAVDVHMSDLIAGRARLDDFKGVIAVGGFSYGDVLGAGEGWAKTILFNAKLAEQFAAFFNRDDTFALGICNGCQMMSNLKSIIPGAHAWPKFTRNKSEQFEARFAMVEVADSPSIFFAGMAGSQTPIAVAHGEGFADFSQTGDISEAHRGDALRRSTRGRRPRAIRTIRTARRKASRR